MQRSHSFVNFVLVSAVLMSLGWGLRGYIGGGPLGAMIPGAFIALWLAILLGLDRSRTALVAVFGTVGVAFGGDMTYGQTLGFLRDNDTVFWGLLGTVVKGGAWGLLGGAVLGMGFVAHRLDARRVALAFGAMLLAAFLGIALVNEPKLIYFSNRLDRPRAEYWAGLLFAAVALLAVLRRMGAGDAPLRCALHGVVGGAAGFGIGGALMAIGFRLEAPLRGLPWWKFMEFTFGACLGAAFGLAAWRMADSLRAEHQPDPPASAFAASLLAGLALVALGLIAWIPATEALMDAARSAPLRPLAFPLGRVLFAFTTLGCALALIGHRFPTLAWHTAITMTFVHSVIDLQEDLGPENGVDFSALFRWGLVAVATLAAAAYVAHWQRDARRGPLAPLLFVVWACMAVAYARIATHANVIAPSPEIAAGTGNYLLRFLAQLNSHRIVHGIFTVCAIVFTVAALRHAAGERRAAS